MAIVFLGQGVAAFRCLRVGILVGAGAVCDIDPALAVVFCFCSQIAVSINRNLYGILGIFGFVDVAHLRGSPLGIPVAQFGDDGLLAKVHAVGGKSVGADVVHKVGRAGCGLVQVDSRHDGRFPHSLCGNSSRADTQSGCEKFGYISFHGCLYLMCV